MDSAIGSWGMMGMGHGLRPSHVLVPRIVPSNAMFRPCATEDMETCKVELL